MSNHCMILYASLCLFCVGDFEPIYETNERMGELIFPIVVVWWRSHSFPVWLWKLICFLMFFCLTGEMSNLDPFPLVSIVQWMGGSFSPWGRWLVLGKLRKMLGKILGSWASNSPNNEQPARVENWYRWCGRCWKTLFGMAQLGRCEVLWFQGVFHQLGELIRYLKCHVGLGRPSQLSQSAPCIRNLEVGEIWPNSFLPKWSFWMLSIHWRWTMLAQLIF